jgi:hypothetical protein
LQDVVLAFVNLRTDQSPADTFDVNVTSNGSNLFGIKSDRTYNVRNIAAYTGGSDKDRRNHWLWSPAKTGLDIMSNGIGVLMNGVPGTDSGWDSVPYEAQYLKVYDVAAPNPPLPQTPHIYAYTIGTSVTFTWNADPNVNAIYAVTVTVNGSNPFSFSTTATSYTYNGTIGDQVSITVRATNPDNNVAQSTTNGTTSVKLLATGSDEDGDGMNNGAEDAAGTNPFDAKSIFKVMTITRPDSNNVSVTWNTVPGKTYRLQSAPTANSNYSTIGDFVATGSTLTEVVTAPTPAFYRVIIP